MTASVPQSPKVVFHFSSWREFHLTNLKSASFMYASNCSFEDKGIV